MSDTHDVAKSGLTLPSSDTVDDALSSFERVWAGVSQGARASLIGERNEVRRLLAALRDYLRELETAAPSSEPPAADGSPRRGPVYLKALEAGDDAFAAAVQGFFDWIVNRTPDQRKAVLLMLDARFCVDCGAFFRTPAEANNHVCPEAGDGTDMSSGDSDDEGDHEPSSRTA